MKIIWGNKPRDHWFWLEWSPEIVWTCRAAWMTKTRECFLAFKLVCQGNDPNSSTCSFFTGGWKWKACFPLQVWAGFWKHVAIWLITGQLIGPWQSTWHLALFLKRESTFDWVARMLKEEHSGNVCLAVFTSIGIDQSSQNYGLWVRSNAHANPFPPWTETCANQLLPHLIAPIVPIAHLCPISL